MLVALTSRISIGTSRVLPSGVISRVSSACKSFGCRLRGRLPISSRKNVPLLAAWNRPIRSSRASVNAPFLCPKSSESSNVEGTVPRSTVTNASSERLDKAWISCATNSLPVPFSPRMSTLASVGAAFLTIDSTWLMASDCPMMGCCRRETSSVSIRFCCLNRCVSSLLLRKRTAAVRVEVRRSLFQGFSIKSWAPIFMASTAAPTEL